MNTHNTGVTVPEILIPDEKVQLKKWAVVACDQFAADRRYWADVQRLVGGAPSAYHIILPEAHLDDPDRAERIRDIQEVMGEYLQDGVLQLLPAGFVLVERWIDGAPRKGLLAAFDLDEYDFDPEAHPLIRPTEQTLLDRLPPRMEIRRGAPVESPHALVLMDDREHSVIEPVYAQKDRLAKLYDFELMQGGGRIAGYFVNDPALTEQILAALNALPLRDGMRFCVGDGNHSIATAKQIWEQTKPSLSEEERLTSPLRYCLAELINLYDPALTFRPIHRVLVKVNPAQALQYVVDALNRSGVEARLIFTRKRARPTGDANSISFQGRDSAGRIELTLPEGMMAADVLQPVLEKYEAQTPLCRLEYVHGDQTLEQMATQYDNIGFYMPALRKEDFFALVTERGVLPKKTFSLGEAHEKRYYLECRLLVEASTDEEGAADEDAPQDDMIEQEEQEEQE